MSKVGDALKKKLGPLPVWVWAIIGGIAVYWYRNRGGGGLLSGGSSAATATAPAPTTPQPVTTLSPGESAYDPNTGGLFTAPGGGDSGSSGSTGNASDPSAAIDALASAITDAIDAGKGSGNNGNSSPATGSSKSPKTNPSHKKVSSTAKRKGKSKPAHTNGNVPTTKVRTPAHKSKGRSTASVRPTGGRTNIASYGKAAESVGRRVVRPTASVGTRLRPKLTLGVTRAGVLQRPQAAHPVSRNRSEPVPAPRPSAPAPRQTRIPNHVSPPKPARKR